MSFATAEVNGTRLFYETIGTGYPLILHHAGIADSRMWESQIEAFAKEYRVIRYDRRGCGQSPMPDGAYSDAEDLYILLQHLDIERAYHVGLSRGAAVALELAIIHPEMVSALVLAAPGTSTGQRSEELQAQFTAIDATFEAGDLAQAVELEVRLWVDGPHRQPDQVDSTIRKLVREMDTNNFKLDNPKAQLLQLDPPIPTRLHEVKVPTLVIVGDGDVSDIVRNARDLSSGIANAKLVTMPDLAHMLNMEQPEDFNRIVLDFLGTFHTN